MVKGKLMDWRVRPKIEDLYMKFTEEVSRMSTCKRLRVGCVIVSGDMQSILSFGYNGNYKKGPNICDSDEVGNCGCIHAEVNALIKAQKDPKKTIFLTDSPCLACTKLIINSGAKAIVYKREYRTKKHLKLLNEAGIEIFQYRGGGLTMIRRLFR